MSRRTKREERALRGELSRNLALFFFDNHEINAILHEISMFGKEPSRKAMALCTAFSNISGNIVPKVLGHIKDASAVLDGDALVSCMSEIFDLLDSHGLEASKRFLEITRREDLESFLEPKALELKKIETFLRAVSGRDMQVLPSPSNDCHRYREHLFARSVVCFSFPR